MARQVNIEFRAKDRVSPVTKKIGDSVSRMPEQFSKSAAALNAFQGASTQMSGKAADLANKLTGIGALVATGGPVGIAIAGATVAVGLLSRAWDENQKQVERQRKIQQLVRDEINKTKQSIETLEEQLRFFGKGALEIQIEKSKEELAARKQQLEADEKLFRSRERLRKGHAEAVVIQEEFNDLIVVDRDITTTSIAIQREEIAVMEKELGLQLKLSDRLQEKARSEQAAADASQRHAQAMRNAAQAAREHDLAMAPLREMLRQMDDEVIGTAGATDELTSRLGQYSRASLRPIKATEELNKSMLSQKEIMRLNQQAAASLLVGMSSAWGTAFQEIAAGSERANQAIIQAVIQSAEVAINAAAASGAAQAAFSQAGIPIIGPALAASASALLFGLIKGFLADVPKAAEGLRITGGTPGVDSVPVLMQRDEVALSPRQTKIMDRFVGSLERAERRGGHGAGSGMTVVNNFRSVGPLISADTMRATRDFVKLQKRVSRRGFR